MGGTTSVKFCSLIVTLLVVYTDFAHGQTKVTNSSIEFLFNVNDRPGDGYLLQWQSPTFPAFARSAQKICVFGMWALYDNEDYGNGSPTNTTAIAVQGTNANDCTTTSVGYIIRTIRSLRPLVADLKPMTMPLCSFWDKKNFIGTSAPLLEPGTGTQTMCPPTTAGTTIGSFAFTEAAQTYFAVLTPKSGTCACVDLTKGPLFVGDTNLFPNAEKPIGDLMSIMAMTTCPTTPAACTMVTTRTFNNVLRSYDFE